MKSRGLVKTVSEVRQNLQTMADYALGSGAEREFHRGRIKNGKNFVAEKLGEEWRFAPSKFVGYRENDTSHMTKLDRRDGGITNSRITGLLGRALGPGDEGYGQVDQAYLDYVHAHGFSPSRHHRGRKCWILGC